ncbi:MAG TPA: rhomboid family intramembrane serine protease, partial [Myxococcaceae bacterium]|nr:rhomboid family intramembrane serine protease [Myxococcaceae bacterium]
TMAVSFFLSEAVSVGASGIVYGCLGAALVFGLRQRAVLPPRYRRVLGEAAILVILIFLWIGLMSAGTDNAAHFGGLLSGMAAAWPLRARSKIGDEEAWRRVLQTGSLVLILGAIAIAPLGVGHLLPRFRTERDQRLGLSVLIPNGWKRTTRSGQLAFYNGLPSFGRAGFAVDVLTGASEVDAARRLRRILEKELQPEFLGPQVLKASVGGPTAALVDQSTGILVPATVEETFGRTRVRAYFVKRGEVTYQLVFSYPSAFPRYGGVIDAMVAGIRFEPK